MQKVPDICLMNKPEYKFNINVSTFIIKHFNSDHNFIVLK